MNFYVQDADRVTLKITGRKEYKFRSRSPLVKFPEKEWKKMMVTEKGNRVEIYLTITKGKEMMGFRPFSWEISADSIDRYLSYRLIEPAYEVWNMLRICERDLESFRVRILADNNITGHSCINCHTSDKGPAHTTFMHIRGTSGGTIYSRQGIVRKIDTKTDSTSAAVYGEIEAGGRFGVFTTADIKPILHSYHTDRLEVYDKRSDLVIIDFEKNVVTREAIVSGREFQETFPCFSSDGKRIYFCRAPHLPQPDSTKQMKYSLCTIGFDPVTGKLGNKIETLIDADSSGISVSFPKCSPDGRFLAFCVSDYGTFPIWHPETDIWLLNLQTGKINKMEKSNGRYSDSYHSWSGNSRWMAFASKRDDRVYGRPYFVHIDSLGEESKPFLMPLRDPYGYISTLKSYNIPELYNTPETYNAKQIEKIYFKNTTEKTILNQ
jgi:hypothetical protein